MKLNRRFTDLVKESFFDKKEFKDINDIFKYKESYKGKVAYCVEDIIMNVEGISEKSFKQLDQLRLDIEKVFESNNDGIESLVKECEDKGYRKQYTAEIIYYNFFRENRKDK